MTVATFPLTWSRGAWSLKDAECQPAPQIRWMSCSHLRQTSSACPMRTASGDGMPQYEHSSRDFGTRRRLARAVPGRSVQLERGSTVPCYTFGADDLVTNARLLVCCKGLEAGCLRVLCGPAKRLKASDFFPIRSRDGERAASASRCESFAPYSWNGCLRADRVTADGPARHRRLSG